METIIINVENKASAKRILEAVTLFNGVSKAALATAEELENISILKACREARKTSKVSKDEVMNALK